MAKKNMKTKKAGRKGLAYQYFQSWKYIRESKTPVYIILILFAFSALIGFVFPILFNQTILNFITQLAEQVKGLDFAGLLSYILQNNLRASFYGLILGLMLGIIPVINILVNGYILGFAGNMAVKEGGYLILLRVLPHGIFEIPALILSLSLGLKLGMWIFQKNKKKYLEYNLENSLRVFLFIIIPLLIIAGIIETGLIYFLG